MPEKWIVTEYPIGFPPKVSVCHTTHEVWLAKRLPWHCGFYTVNPVYPQPKGA